MTTILRRNTSATSTQENTPAANTASGESSSSIEKTPPPTANSFTNTKATIPVSAADDLDIPDDADFSSFMDTVIPESVALSPGKKIRATVVSTNDEWIFLDIGDKSEGTVARSEFTDKEGALTVHPGEEVEVFFLQEGKNGKRFTRRLGGSDTSVLELEEAHHGKIPVEGEVAEEIKGGYLVRIGKVRAFCPFSQIGIRRDDDESPVGRTLQFLITEIRDHGKSVVLSRRLLLEEERQRRLQEMREKVQVGQCVAGTITSIRDFGAFVDIGGLEGLIPAREISWDSSAAISDILRQGDRVEVEILALDWSKERFTFSLKRAGLDPWTQVKDNFPAGSTCNGTVSRLMPFGAFIKLAPGVEGLIHISRLGDRSLKHPKEALDDGQQLEVRIESLDLENRRISLLPADLSQLKHGGGRQEENLQDGSEEDVAAYLASRKEHAEADSTMGALLQQAAEEARGKKGTKNS